MSDPNDFIIENGVLKQYKGSDANVVVPDGVEVIGETAFFEHREIQTISLPAGTEMCMPGDHVTMDIELITPVAIEQGMRFAIREGGRTVASGVVSAINE